MSRKDPSVPVSSINFASIKTALIKPALIKTASIKGVPINTSSVQVIDQPFRYPQVRSDRAREVARYFEIEDRTAADAHPQPLMESGLLESMLPCPGKISLITGASGSGKSSLLASVRQQLTHVEFVDLAQIELHQVPIVDLFPHLTLPETLGLLSKTGLSEAWSYLRLPAELSDGQQWRLRIALALEAVKQNPGAVLVCDEFAAVLDRITARIVSHRVSKWVAEHKLRALLVTAHDDLSRALNPAIHVRCDFNQVTIRR